ncbi:MAG: 3-phosphoshikimate 1-carboxyvinyltransferase [Syntrophales bacterium]
MQEIKPLKNLDATVRLPGSKSYTQRAMVIAALAQGESTLRNVLVAEDTLYLKEALRALGAEIKENGDILIIQGTEGHIKCPEQVLFLGNNGTALRFLTTVAALGSGRFVLTGEPRLCERPVQPLLDALAALGVQSHAELGCPPVTIKAKGLGSGRAAFANIASSQYVSSLLICAPYAQGEVDICVSGPTVSKPYITMTIEAMHQFGVEVSQEGEGDYRVGGGQCYQGRTYLVEGDVSTASYFFLAAALCGGKVQVLNINPRSLQGDIELLRIMETLGCRVTRGENCLELAGGKLTAGDYTFDMGDLPDMVPTLAVLAAFREGCTKITNVAHLRIKESNRIAALVSEISRIGVRAEELPDGLVIWGGKPHGAEIETYNDHRLAMSFAIAGLAAPGMRIKNHQCVKKSFPAFWEELDKLYG